MANPLHPAGHAHRPTHPTHLVREDPQSAEGRANLLDILDGFDCLPLPLAPAVADRRCAVAVLLRSPSPAPAQGV